MDISRIKYLRQELEDEVIDTVEIAEIEAAFAEIPDEELRDLRENALAGDMLDELEARVTPVEKAIYEWIKLNFGESEANDPSFSVADLAFVVNNVEVVVGSKRKKIGDLQ